MLGSCSKSFTYGESSFEYDDNSSLDSGIERSYEKLSLDKTCTSEKFRKHKFRNSKVSLEEFKELEKEFQPTSIEFTSTPVKPKRKYAQGKSRISRSQSPTQIMKIKKYRRVKANDRERNRMHSLNEALGKTQDELET